MGRRTRRGERRALLDAKLTELMLFAKELCPSARVEGNTLQYDGEDGRVLMFPPPGLSDAEEDRLEEALGDRAWEIFSETGLYIVYAVLELADPPQALSDPTIDA